MRRPGHSTVVAYLALFAALGGGAYAAATIDSSDVVNDSLRSIDIRDGSLLEEDIRAEQSTAPAIARVTSTGTYDLSRSKGVIDVDHSTNTGIYCFDLNFTPKVAVASPFANNNATVATAVSGENTAILNGCETAHQDAVVVTRAAETGAAADAGFSIVFE